MIWKVGLSLVVVVAGLAGAIGLGAEDEKLAVTGIEAVHRDGQTFVMWRDAAEGAAGARCRYSLYRSSKPITEPTLRQAHLVYRGVVNNSAKLFGADFRATDRLDPDKPTVTLPFRGRPLDGFPLAISSSQIRARVRAGLPIEWLVPPAVAEAIRNNRLYL